MSYTSFGLNDAFAVKLWSKNLAIAERAYLDIQPLMGEDDNSIIQIQPGTKKSKGDKVTFGLRARLQGDGVSEGQLAEGNGESLSIYSDAVVINELGHVVASRSENTIDAQRVPFNLREQCKDALAQWWGDRKSVTFFNQVCGNTFETRTVYTGLNATIAPSSNRKVNAGGVANDENLTSSNPFTLDLIDTAVQQAKVGDNLQKVRPVRIGGLDKYVVYLHPIQVTALRKNSAAGQWLDIAKAALQGGEITKNPIYTGALGEYNGCILRSSQDVPMGLSSASGAQISTVRRAVLLGAQSAMVAMGQQGGSPNKYRWNEELFDHKRKLEISAWSIWGLKKSVFNAQDFGTVVISSYAV